MGEKSNKAGWNLAWGRSVGGQVQKCDFCQKETHKLQYAMAEKKWSCLECAHRPMLVKGKLFGKIRPISAKEYDKQNNFVQNTKFEA